MNSRIPKYFDRAIRTLFIVLSLGSLNSCTSKVETLINDARLNFAEFDRILANADTIPKYRLNDLDSSFKQVRNTKMSEFEYLVFNNLRDSLEDYHAINSSNMLMLELFEWEKELMVIFSGEVDSEVSEIIASKSRYFVEYLNENREHLTQEQIQRINSLLGKQTAAETKELLKNVENGFNDLLQRTESWFQNLEEVLDK